MCDKASQEGTIGRITSAEWHIKGALVSLRGYRDDVPPFRFGLLVEAATMSRYDIGDVARRAEDDGYDIVLATDHLGQLAPLPMLLSVADAASVRIGTLVLNNDFRHPVVLAHELASIDALSGGRIEIGMGAGWARGEYDGAAIAFDQPGKRLARLATSMAIIKQALSEGRVQTPPDSPYGSIQLDDVPCSVQRPHPPVLIGGGGPRTLAFAAGEAQIVGIDPRALPGGGHVDGDVTEAIIDEKVSWIRAAAGDRFADLELNVIIFEVDPDYRPGAHHTSIRSEVLSTDDIARSPHYLLGDTDAMVDRLIERRERWGINYLALKREHMDLLAPVIARLAGQ